MYTSWLPAIWQKIWKRQRKIMFESYCCYISIIDYCLIVTWYCKNSILSKLKSGGTAPVATALHHFRAYRLLTLVQTYTYGKTKLEFHDHYAYIWPTAVVFNLWAIEAFCGGLQSYLSNCNFGWKNVLIIGAVGPVRELAQNLRFLAWISFFLWRSPENWKIAIKLAI